MISQILKTIFVLSCVGGLLYLVLFALKPITKRVFGSRWQYYIWLVLLIVMMLPVTIKLPAETFTSEQIPSTQVLEGSVQPVEQSANTPDAVISQDIPVQMTIADTINRMTIESYDVVFYIWFLGFLIFFVSCLIRYWIFLGTIRKNSDVVSCPGLYSVLEEKGIKGNVRVCSTGCINAPFIIGIFRPALIIPNIDMSESELHYIMLHELTHLKRRDLLYKWFAFFVNAVHWFNPFIYFAVGQINEECEISCDLAVIQSMNEQEKRGYMNTILMLLSEGMPKKQVLTTAMASGKNQIKRRFKMIKKATSKSKIIMLVSAIAAFLILAVSVYASGVLNDSIQAQNLDKDSGNQTNILFIGVDGNEQMRADSLMLLSLNKVNNTLAVLSIPRDTLIKTDGQDNKIANLMTDGDDQKVIDAVRNNLSIPVNYYARLNFEGFRNIIDILGGVEFDVPVDMQYDDIIQDLRISLDKGLQILDGAKAEQLVRYRAGYPEGDIARVRIQQSFINELIKQKLNTKYLTEISGLYNEFSKNVVTNYPFANIAADAIALNQIDAENIEIFTLPGTTEMYQGMSYFIVNDTELKNLTEQYFSLNK